MRKRRIASETGFYHVVMRGVGKQVIFESDADRRYFLSSLQSQVEKTGVSIHAFCLMDNHFHLLVHDSRNELSQFMCRIGTSYAMYFNKKHDHTGHVFQGRFHSETIDDTSYYLTVLRYVIQNPLKANLGMKAVLDNTSFRAYFERGYEWASLMSVDYALSLAGSEDLLFEFLLETNSDTCLESQPYEKFSDAELRRFICKYSGIDSHVQAAALPKDQRDRLLSALVELEPSDSRIERETGIGRTIIRRVRRQATLASVQQPTEIQPEVPVPFG